MQSIPSLLVLGLLAERPWTAYELVKHLSPPSMAAAVWDVSERTWYREPARLVAAGLAEAHESGDGSPTRYAITGAGRRALEEASPTENRMVYRNEVMAILYAVAAGPLDDIDARLEELRLGLLRGMEALAVELRRLAEAGPKLPRRAHVTALLGRMNAAAMKALYDWAVGAQHDLRDLGPDGDRARFAQKIWQQVADDLDAFTEGRRAQ